ncbi:unnamed protein product [Acanthoscelides obtectus]|uniref:Uncharacterized protein n=1 Tax=Acanthoscelides obtectus TaxID=200917 RepID=A0A9P0JS76_ACAOB|nr:unnamed protein product [Acanthoscelides obtectus]CAK1672377.1 hypothetical protein AOBTE_LOCUS28837 [Acanthoscelides obtectus]
MSGRNYKLANSSLSPSGCSTSYSDCIYKASESVRTGVYSTDSFPRTAYRRKAYHKFLVSPCAFNTQDRRIYAKSSIPLYNVEFIIRIGISNLYIWKICIKCCS